jgi:hypothetical protein
MQVVPLRDGGQNGRRAHWNKVTKPLILGGMRTDPAAALTPAFGTSRHPFRAQLPARVLHRLPRLEPEVQARIDAAAAVAAQDVAVVADRRRWLITARDVKDFLIAYVACFLAVSAFLS